MGSGPTNRHGMPQLPPGQTPTQAWPVLDLGVKPKVAREKWRLVVDGACQQPLCLGWDDLMAMETAWARARVSAIRRSRAIAFRPSSTSAR